MDMFTVSRHLQKLQKRIEETSHWTLMGSTALSMVLDMLPLHDRYERASCAPHPTDSPQLTPSVRPATRRSPG